MLWPGYSPLERATNAGAAMSEPTCKIEWFYEGYQSVWLYDATGGDKRFKDFCIKLGSASVDAHSVAALGDAVERAATDMNLHVRSYPGPSHADPLRITFRVGVFIKPPAEWIPPDDGVPE
jgi:hypothetical protein